MLVCIAMGDGMLETYNHFRDNKRFKDYNHCVYNIRGGGKESRIAMAWINSQDGDNHGPLILAHPELPGGREEV